MMQAICFGLMVMCLLGYFAWDGYKRGVRAERERVCSLCHQAVIGTNSPSAKWIWNAVSEGMVTLDPNSDWAPQAREAQRRSFAFGNAAIDNSDVTPEVVDRAEVQYLEQRLREISLALQELFNEQAALDKRKLKLTLIDERKEFTCECVVLNQDKWIHHEDEALKEGRVFLGLCAGRPIGLCHTAKKECLKCHGTGKPVAS